MHQFLTTKLNKFLCQISRTLSKLHKISSTSIFFIHGLLEFKIIHLLRTGMKSNLGTDPKFLFDRSDLSNEKDLKIKNLIPTLDGPKPKRRGNIKGEVRSKFKFNQYEEKEEKRRMKFGKDDSAKQQSKDKDGTTKQKNRKSKNSSYQFSNLSNDQERQCENITEILSYFLGEYESSGKAASTKSNIYMDWEINQIAKNYEDTNLGDFVIKLPNPDSMPKDIMDVSEEEDLPTFTFTEAFENYDQMFNTELNIDRNMDQYQKKAFILAFYLLEFESYYQRPKSPLEDAQKKEKQKKQNAAKFIGLLDYYREISNITYLDYLGKMKDQDFKNQEKDLSQKIQEMKSPIEEAYKKSGVKVETFELLFTEYKKSIYTQLDLQLKSNTRRGGDIAQDIEILQIFQLVPSLSFLLRTFPKFLIKLRKEANRKIIKSKNIIKKKIVGGNYLKKVSNNGELRWVRSAKRPADVYTLLRNILLFRLSRRGGLFIRTFLSEDENYIFLVIKASEGHLEKMAQKSNYIMEVELGATDIFSFQPVDKYNRPLRTNRYVRDPSFIRKYSLSTNKKDKDEGNGDNSAQSEAITYYGKAQKMNEEELRAKVILDQEELDQCYRWLSKTTGVRYIHASQTLNNNYNKNEVSSKIWPVYYIYNKMIIDGLRNLRNQLEGTKKGNKGMYNALMNNLGLILRLIFLKAIWVSNQLYRNHRRTFFRGLKNALTNTDILETIWDRMGEQQPRAYWPYFSSRKMERIWRKHQISEEKYRSKFTPAARITITNDIVREYVNVSKAMTQRLLIEYFPIHDPFILKNILLRPYLNVITNLLTDQDGVAQINENSALLDITESLVAYECEKTKQDFTKKSVKDKLAFACGKLTHFSVNTVCFYCGEKLAFYFQFRRFLAKSAFPFIFITFIIQILFWVELGQITLNGSSNLTGLNNVLMCILVIINIIWVDRTIQRWCDHQKVLARSFGTATEGKKDQNAQVRILFSGKMKRNMETDEMNDQQASAVTQFLKSVLSFFINIVFVVCMGATILIIFALKNQMYQRGLDQSSITVLPSLLIAVTVQVFNFIYGIIVKLIVDFQNKKTIPEYESSLSSKAFIITFVVSFYALFIYGFFSGYFQGSDVCTLKTSTGEEIYDCYYYMSSQITTSALVDLAVTIVMAFVPMVMFKLKLYLSNKDKNQNVTFNLNYFESIDRFYQEQDRMQSYMYNDQIDNTWQGYTAVAVAFSMLILFGPIVPFLYLMIFINGIVSLHAKKYEIIYLSRRGLPIRVNSIGSWITMLKVVSVIGVFTNVGVVVYVREVFSQRQSVIYFSVVFVALALRYVATILFTTKEDIVGKRSKFKTSQLILEKGLSDFSTNTDQVNTDIENVYYDESKLNRRLPNLKGANVRRV